MSWTKQQVIEAAFEEIGLDPAQYELQPSQLQSALRRLDSMMATWGVNGVRVGYPAGGGFAQDTFAPDWALESMYLNLAIRLAPMYGKAVGQETRQNADDTFRSITQQASGLPPEVQMPGTMPAGAGAKPWRTQMRPFLNPPVDPLESGEDGPIDFE